MCEITVPQPFNKKWKGQWFLHFFKDGIMKIPFEIMPVLTESYTFFLARWNKTVGEETNIKNIFSLFEYNFPPNCVI